MPSVRATIVSNLQQQKQTIAVFPSPTVHREDVFKVARNKLGLKKPSRIFTAEAVELTASPDPVLSVANGVTLYVSTHVDFIGVPKEDGAGTHSTDHGAANGAEVLVLGGHNKDPLAMEQLHATARRPHMRLVAAMPDLHAGPRSHPVGAAFISDAHLFPALVGGDLGCGMLLLRTRLDAGANVDRAAVKLRGIGVEEGMEGEWTHGCESWKRFVGFEDFSTGGASTSSAASAGPNAGIHSASFDRTLGTIGGGNHFAELTVIEEVFDEEIFASLDLNYNRLLLLVHSGSRGLGAAVLDDVESRMDENGALEAGSEAATTYLKQHEACSRWARANRMLIAHRMLSVLGERSYEEGPETLLQGRQILDIGHNRVDRLTPEEVTTLGLEPSDGGEARDQSLWIHRKGAAPSNEGLVVIPGSRGTLSYLVQPINNGRANAFSLAHGAGRALSRHKAHAAMARKYGEESKISTLLERTALGGRVICEDRSLLFEEAPEAYYDAGDAVKALERAGVVKVVLALRPYITYKCVRS